MPLPQTAAPGAPMTCAGASCTLQGLAQLRWRKVAPVLELDGCPGREAAVAQLILGPCKAVPAHSVPGGVGTAASLECHPPCSTATLPPATDCCGTASNEGRGLHAGTEHPPGTGRSGKERAVPQCAAERGCRAGRLSARVPAPCRVERCSGSLSIPVLEAEGILRF